MEVIGNTVTIINNDGFTTLTPKNEETPELLTEFLNGNQPLPAEEIFHITRAALIARDAANTEKRAVDKTEPQNK